MFALHWGSVCAVPARTSLAEATGCLLWAMYPVGPWCQFTVARTTPSGIGSACTIFFVCFLEGWLTSTCWCKQMTRSWMGSFSAQAQRGATGFVRPSSCAQLANHPCSGVTANCGFLSITVPPGSEFGGLPVRSIRGGKAVGGAVITVLVSLCDIPDGAEITVDYEYGLGAPDWYSPSASPQSAPATLSLQDYWHHSEVG
mmetsp:Transcript_98814/g.264252  ORF Transcript_98814/g.264252 Transcript_98814/m.264252 type:complete len:200 (+) Transcript_98814:245-844(+)